MRRVLWSWRGIEVYSYPALLYLGLVFGVVAGNYVANLAGLDSARVFIATLSLLVPALVGARLLYVASCWETYRGDPARICRRSEGGAALYGGLPFALLVSVPLLRALRLPFGAFWDVAIFTILLGMIFARFGCLLNGCCAGRPSDGWLALYLPDHRGLWKRRIPTQLLEAGWAGLLLLGAALFRGHAPFPGSVFLGALAGYGLARLVLEATREEQDTVGALAIHRAISAVLVVLAVTVLAIGWAG
jgi:phosphatidylglycerol:prolipoprotein diacylglycerol transferase